MIQTPGDILIKGRTKTRDVDKGYRSLQRRIRQDVTGVKIGVQADEEQTLLIIAAANEYGATINHPGGTAYGYKTAADAKKHKVRFLKGGTGHKVLGTTEAHTIIIPSRSYIRSTVDEKEDQYHKLTKRLLARVIDGDIDKHGALETIGLQVEADIKRKMTTLKNPPNAPSTIRKKKGEDNPLIDKGHLRNSIRYVVT